jgi:hypothetical protein
VPPTRSVARAIPTPMDPVVPTPAPSGAGEAPRRGDLGGGARRLPRAEGSAPRVARHLRQAPSSLSHCIANISCAAGSMVQVAPTGGCLQEHPSVGGESESRSESGAPRSMVAAPASSVRCAGAQSTSPPQMAPPSWRTDSSSVWQRHASQHVDASKSARPSVTFPSRQSCALSGRSQRHRSWPQTSLLRAASMRTPSSKASRSRPWPNAWPIPLNRWSAASGSLPGPIPSRSAPRSIATARGCCSMASAIANCSTMNRAASARRTASGHAAVVTSSDTAAISGSAFVVLRCRSCLTIGHASNAAVGARASRTQRSGSRSSPRAAASIHACSRRSPFRTRPVTHTARTMMLVSSTNAGTRRRLAIVRLPGPSSMGHHYPT